MPRRFERTFTYVLKNRVAEEAGQYRVKKQELYKTFNATGNWAEKTGHILVHVKAIKTESFGFVRNWRRNAVKEPLEEAGIDIEISEE